MKSIRLLPTLAMLAIAGALYHAWQKKDALAETIPGLAAILPATEAVEPAPGIISMGRVHIVALRSDGTIYGWGDNREKELGLAGHKLLPVPKPIATGQSWKFVYTGNTAAYAISSDGRLWRRGFEKRSGRDESEFLALNIDYLPLFPKIRWQKVLESQGRTAGLDTHGRLWTWDENLLEKHGRLIVRGEPEVQLRLNTDGTLATDVANGSDDQWMSESQAFLERTKQQWTQQHMPSEPGFLDTPAGKPVLDKLTAMVESSMAEEKLRRETYQQAQATAAQAIIFPAPITPDRDWADFCIDRVSGGLKGPGTIYALDREGGLWKSGEPLATGLVKEIVTFEMSRIAVSAKLQKIYCRENANVVFAIDEQGQLWGFGQNGSGRLGNGDGSVYGKNEPIPESAMQVLNKKRWIEIAPGITATFGITRDGALWGWGANHGGALGTGDDDSHHDVPTLVDNSNKWVAVAAGYSSAAAITADGQLFTWGDNGGGTLGEGGAIQTRDRPGHTTEPAGWLVKLPKGIE